MNLQQDIEKRANEKLTALIKQAEPSEEPLPDNDKGEALDRSYSPKIEEDNSNEFTGLLAKVLSGQVPSQTTIENSTTSSLDGLNISHEAQEPQIIEEDLPIGDLISALNPSHIVDQNMGE
jgi:hypothetical protein